MAGPKGGRNAVSGAARRDGIGAVVLLSAGLDSTVALYEALRVDGVQLALTFDYGQRAARREAERARRIARGSGVAHRLVRLPWLAELSRGSALSAGGPELPEPSEEELSSRRPPVEVWIPNRNAVFIAVAAAFAEALGSRSVYAGLNAEEGATFPDNSAEFVRAANAQLACSTLSGVRLVAPLAGLAKPAIVRRGAKLGAPLGLIWACYRGGRTHCGRCESCLRAARAFREAGAPRALVPAGLA